MTLQRPDRTTPDVYICDGYRMLAASLSPRGERTFKGPIKEPDTAFRDTIKSMWTMLGRSIEGHDQGTLSDLLAKGAEAAFLEPNDEFSWPGVETRIELSSFAYTLRVRIDPTRGYMPRWVQLWDLDRQQPAQEISVVECVSLDGKWLPSLVS